MARARILIIYTGGTIGMIRDRDTGRLRPFQLEGLFSSIPSIRNLGIEIHALELRPIIDSSNVTPAIWTELAALIGKYYGRFDGFLVLHGTDTMAYSASALSFLLDCLNKPVIFTGSQLPIGLPRTDARENLITSLEIAAMKKEDGTPLVPEVCIYFEDKLYRANRTHKFNSENFDAFLSLNYPVLADAGVNIKVYRERLLAGSGKKLKVHHELNPSVAVVRLFPGIDIRPYAEMMIGNGTEALILESYGSGNGPTDASFLDSVRKLVRQNITVLNITQCREGRVEMGKYECSQALLEMGVASGADLTAEAAIAKTMYVLALTQDPVQRFKLLEKPLRGEMSA